MASGIASPWGMSPQMVAGMNNSLDVGSQHLTGQLNLTSNPPSFNKNGAFVSPLNVQNESYYYNGLISFGKKKSKISLKSLNADIKYLR